MNNIEKAINYINNLNLASIKLFLQKKLKWKKRKLNKCEEQYKNYLILKKKYGNKYKLPPSMDIDEFWHAHILDTKQYFKDCNKIFSYYLHHTPGYSANYKYKIFDIDNEFRKTQELYFLEFGKHL